MPQINYLEYQQIIYFYGSQFSKKCHYSNRVEGHQRLLIGSQKLFLQITANYFFFKCCIHKYNIKITSQKRDKVDIL
jgi:hypothetical protein